MPENFVLHTTPIEEMLDKLSVDRVFGTPTHEGGITIIPVAQVDMGFGYGGGYAPDSSNKESALEQEGSKKGGAGSGGGGGGRATPRGYLHITPDGVRYEPIIDATRIPLAGILMGAWAIFWITATVRTIAKAIAKRKKGV